MAFEIERLDAPSALPEALRYGAGDRVVSVAESATAPFVEAEGGVTAATGKSPAPNHVRSALAATTDIFSTDAPHV